MMLAFGASTPIVGALADEPAEQPDTAMMAENLAEEMQKAHGGKWGVHMDPGNGLLVISRNLGA